MITGVIIMQRRNLRISTVFLFMYFLLAPFEDSLNFGFGTILKFIGGFYVIFAILEMFLYNITFKIRVFHIAAILLIIISYLSYFWARVPSLVIDRNTAYLLLISFFVLSSLHGLNNKEKNYLEKTVIISGVMLTAVLLFIKGVSIDGRFILNEGDDPNALAALLILPTFVTLNSILKSDKYKILYIIVFLFITAGLLATGSRGALFSTGFILIWYTLDVLNRKGKISSKLLTILLVSMCIGLFIVLIPNSLYSRYFDSNIFENELLSPYSRTSIWKTVINSIIPSMPLLGYGSGNAYLIVGEYLGKPMSSHNLLFDILLQYGYLGIVVFLIFLLSITSFLIKNKRKDLIYIFFAILLVTVFLEGLSKKYFWNVIMFIILTAQIDRKKEIK